MRCSRRTFGPLWRICAVALVRPLRHDGCTRPPSLRGSDDAYRTFFLHAPDAVLVVDRDGTIVAANHQAVVLFGYSSTELVGQPVEVLLPERVRLAHRKHRGMFVENQTARPMGQGLDLWAVRRDGTELPVDVSLSPATTPAGVVTLAAVRDISEQRRADHALRVSEARFRRIFEDAPIGMALLDGQHRLREVNGALCEMLAADPHVVIGRTLADLTPAEDSDKYAEQLDRLLAGELEGFAVEKRLVTDNSRVIWTQIVFSSLHDGPSDGPTAIAMIQDVTERKQAETKLAHLATHDELTGLANRALFEHELGHVQARSARSGQHYAVLFVDLDDFKRVNDDHGHGVGDLVLAEVGRRIAAAVRPGDIAARHGGDEFVMVCDGLGHTPREACGGATTIVDRLAEVLQQPVTIPGTAIALTAAVGVVIDRGTATAAVSLVAAADAAMYDAKRSGAGAVVFAFGSSASLQ